MRPRSWGTNTLLVPNLKVKRDQSPRSLRYRCCAYDTLLGVTYVINFKLSTRYFVKLQPVDCTHPPRSNGCHLSGPSRDSLKLLLTINNCTHNRKISTCIVAPNPQKSYFKTFFFRFADRPTALGGLCSQLTFRLAWCREHTPLRRQSFCSRRTSLVELSFGPAAQSRHHLRTVQTTAEGTPFREAWTRRSVTSDMGALEKHLLTYLLTYLLTFVFFHTNFCSYNNMTRIQAMAYTCQWRRIKTNT